MGVRVTPNLDTLGTVFVATRPLKETYPDVVFNGQNYVMVWGDMNLDSVNFYMVTARVSPDGSVLDTPAVLSTALGVSDANNAKVAFDGNRCLAVWNTDAGSIGARFINSAGQPDGNMFWVLANGGSKPDIAFDGTNYLVVWNSAGYDIMGQRVSPQGQMVGSRVTIATGSQTQIFPSVTYDGLQYLVVWRQVETSSRLICGQLVNTSGGLIGSNFTISDASANEKWFAAAAASDQNYLVAWDENRGAATDIYGNVDVAINAIEEQGPKTVPRARLPSVVHGSLDLYRNRVYRIYDSQGRLVESRGRMTPGVYFLQSNRAGAIETQKVLVVE